jgi:hypothetical protein
MFFAASASLLSDKYDSIAAKVRKAKGKKVILCSPEGKEDGSLEPGKALAQLKRGMTIKFLPGNYPAEIMINEDNVIIEGEPGKECGIDLKINGKKCIVRNLYNFMTIEARKDITIVDSVINKIQLFKKVNSTMYNCAIGSIGVCCSDSKTDLGLKYCTIRDNNRFKISKKTIFLSGTGTISFFFDNCVLYSPESLIGVHECSSKKHKFTFKNSIFYGETCLGEKYSKASSGKTAYIARNIKDFKKIAKVFMTGSKIEKPVFIKNKPGKKEIEKLINKRIYNLLPPDTFTLAENSPGKDMGVGIKSVNAEGFPAP